MNEVQKSRIKGVNIVFLVSILISVIVPFLPLDFLEDRVILSILFSQGILALPAVIYLLLNKVPYAEAVRLKKLKVSDLLLALLFGILTRPLMTLLNALSLVFSTNIINVTIMDVLKDVPFLGGLFLVAVLPAVVEESVYRGVFYNEYSKIHVLKAALLSGLLFGIMHGNFNQFCYTMVMGVLFALVIEATGSILASMLVHFWVNASSVVVMYVYPMLYKVAQSYYNMYKEYGNETMATALENFYGDMTLNAEEWVQQMMGASANLTLTVPQVLVLYGPQALIMSVLAFFVYKKLAIRNGNWYRICESFKPQSRKAADNDTEEEPKQRMVTIPLIVGILIGVAFMVVYEILLQSAM